MVDFISRPTEKVICLLGFWIAPFAMQTRLLCHLIFLLLLLRPARLEQRTEGSRWLTVLKTLNKVDPWINTRYTQPYAGTRT